MRRASILLATVCLMASLVASTAEGAARQRPARTAARGHSQIQRSIDGIGTGIRKPLSSFVASSIDCTATTAPGATNTQLDCDGKTPNNEPHIVVDPNDPLHMIASSNDNDSCCEEFYTTFDGGATWSTGNSASAGKHRYGGDPVTVIDPKSGNAIHAALSYRFTPSGQSTDGDVVASISTDGGLTWPTIVEVYDGNGADLDPTQVFNDKEWIVTDTNPTSPYYGRSYITWSRFLFHHGRYEESPIWESHSDDGGLTWSPGQEISGSASFCTYQEAGPAGQCDEDQGSIPVVAPDGSVHVAFINEQNPVDWETGKELESSYLVVTSADGGATWGAPMTAVAMEDGRHDLPRNVDGAQTITDYQVRLWSPGNITVGNDGTLFIVFADNRAGTHDVPDPISNMDIYVVTSTDGGATWTTPVGVDTGPGDQWFPWGDVNPVTGQLGVLYNDRDPSDPDLYNASLAVGMPGSFTKSTVSAASSDPTNSLFFQANVTGCKKCATFHGDYISLDYGSDGLANMVWTDMSVLTDTFGGEPLPHPRTLQFIFFARV